MLFFFLIEKVSKQRNIDLCKKSKHEPDRMQWVCILYIPINTDLACRPYYVDVTDVGI